jgi:arsenate reductase
MIQKPKVLFVCVHNAGRSQMAAGFMTSLSAGRVDVVITMGCGDACPFFPGKRYIDWVLDDPSGQDIAKIRVIRDEIKERVKTLLTELLPHEKVSV